ncbi:helix-hairpin-helix domain-containing protein [Flavobacterium jejuense]|uniref:Helix-hairpin-helix domain-containing protein n=1 Tax=Flavobacterium jejuense TaxID=1544455 RepID=A0ABX0INI4_9FLAO|nr:helix-hairpin-helix domain-containing protein [Flavobacterium jejuense]NHN25364.1 helix-hairpin-helix domain-containing protein [Flavobacterium jejuense]
MKEFKSYFLFSREHRSGIFLLFILVILIQSIYFILKSNNFFYTSKQLHDKEWLLVQNKIDSIKKSKIETGYQPKAFNPNFITDYKGYLLGMSLAEIDRLHQYRALNKFVNSAYEFQKVTQVSDSLLTKISPLFKFPDWVNAKKDFKPYGNFNKKVEEKIVSIDLNSATKEDLMKVYGIGDKISDIVLKEKEKFGTFASVDQLEFVWGISSEVLEDCKLRFFVQPNSSLKKININTASTKELMKFPYFNYAFAKEIVTYRSMNGVLSSIEDLAKINNCPLEKLKIIALYLEF